MGLWKRFCRIQSQGGITYKACARDEGDDDVWDVVCETSNDGTYFNADNGCTATFVAFKGATGAISVIQSMNEEGGFCSASVDEDENSVSLECQDGWNSVAYKGDESGHAAKRICRIHLEGAKLTGRCLDVEEEERYIR